MKHNLTLYKLKSSEVLDYDKIRIELIKKFRETRDRLKESGNELDVKSIDNNLYSFTDPKLDEVALIPYYESLHQVVVYEKQEYVLDKKLDFIDLDMKVGGYVKSKDVAKDIFKVELDEDQLLKVDLHVQE